MVVSPFFSVSFKILKLIYVKSLQDDILSPVIALLLMVGGVESDMEKLCNGKY